MTYNNKPPINPIAAVLVANARAAELKRQQNRAIARAQAVAPASAFVRPQDVAPKPDLKSSIDARTAFGTVAGAGAGALTAGLLGSNPLGWGILAGAAGMAAPQIYDWFTRPDTDPPASVITKPLGYTPTFPGEGNNRPLSFRADGSFGAPRKILGWTKPNAISQMLGGPIEPILKDEYTGANPLTNLAEYGQRDAWREQYEIERSARDNPGYEATSPGRILNRFGKNYGGDFVRALATVPENIVGVWSRTAAMPTKNPLSKAYRFILGDRTDPDPIKGNGVLMELLRPLEAEQQAVQQIYSGTRGLLGITKQPPMSEKALDYMLAGKVSDAVRTNLVVEYIKNGTWPESVPKPNWYESLGAHLAYNINNAQDNFKNLPLGEQIFSLIATPKLVSQGIKVLTGGKQLIPAIQGISGLSEGFTPTMSLFEDLGQINAGRTLAREGERAGRMLLEQVDHTPTNILEALHTKLYLKQTPIRKVLNYAIEKGFSILDLQRDSKARQMVKVVLPTINEMINRFDGNNIGELLDNVRKLGDATPLTLAENLSSVQKEAISFFQDAGMWSRKAGTLERSMYGMADGSNISAMNSIGGLTTRKILGDIAGGDNEKFMKLLSNSRILPGATTEAINMAKESQSELLNELMKRGLSSLGDTSPDPYRARAWHKWQQWYASRFTLGPSFGFGLRNLQSEFAKMFILDSRAMSMDLKYMERFGGSTPEFIARNIGFKDGVRTVETRDYQGSVNKSKWKIVDAIQNSGFIIAQKGEEAAGLRYYWATIERFMNKWSGRGLLTEGGEHIARLTNASGVRVISQETVDAIDSFARTVHNPKDLDNFIDAIKKGLPRVEYNKELRVLIEQASQDTSVDSEVIRQFRDAINRYLESPNASKGGITKIVYDLRVSIEASQNAIKQAFGNVTPAGPTLVLPTDIEAQLIQPSITVSSNVPPAVAVVPPPPAVAVVPPPPSAAVVPPPPSAAVVPPPPSAAVVSKIDSMTLEKVSGRIGQLLKDMGATKSRQKINIMQIELDALFVRKGVLDEEGRLAREAFQPEPRPAPAVAVVQPPPAVAAIEIPQTDAALIKIATDPNSPTAIHDKKVIMGAGYSEGQVYEKAREALIKYHQQINSGIDPSISREYSEWRETFTGTDKQAQDIWDKYYVFSGRRLDLRNHFVQTAEFNARNIEAASSTVDITKIKLEVGSYYLTDKAGNVILDGPITLDQFLNVYVPRQLGQKPIPALGTDMTNVPLSFFVGENAPWASEGKGILDGLHQRLTSYQKKSKEIFKATHSYEEAYLQEYYLHGDYLVNNIHEDMGNVNFIINGMYPSPSSVYPLAPVETNQFASVVANIKANNQMIVDLIENSPKMTVEFEGEWYVVDKANPDILGLPHANKIDADREIIADAQRIQQLMSDYGGGTLEDIADLIANPEKISAESLARAFNVSPEVGEAIFVLAQKINLPLEDILVARGGEAAQDALTQGAKGSMEIVEGGKALIRGFANSDTSTAVHEIAHVARRFLFDINIPEANRLGITNADINIAEAWSGVTNGVWEAKNDEKFARGFERYMRDGNAPTDGLKRIFAKFEQWLGDIYKVLTGSEIDIEVSPQMREVFDRLVTRSEFKVAPPSDAVSDFMVGQRVPVSNVGAVTVSQGMPGVEKIPTSEIKVDPARFQFKGGFDPKTGATTKLKNVTGYDYDAAGVITLWESKEGELFVINGHHRVEIAKRFNIGEMNVLIKREVDGFTEANARAHGAILNMQEGQGTPIDVAKFLRESGNTIESLKNRGVSVTERLVVRGVALSELDQTLFSQVVMGIMPEDVGVVIGQGLPKEFANQIAVAKMVTNAKKQLDPNKIRILIEQAKGDSVTISQTTMFGTTAEEKSTLLEKVDLIDYLEKEFSTDSRVFGAVSKKGRAEALARGNTKVDVETAKGIVKESKTMLEVFRAKVKYIGLINDIVRDSAAQVVKNGYSKEIYETALERIRNAITSGDAIGAKGLTGVSGSAAGEPLTVALQARPATDAAYRAHYIKTGLAPSLLEYANEKLAKRGLTALPPGSNPKSYAAQWRIDYPPVDPTEAQLLARDIINAERGQAEFAAQQADARKLKKNPPVSLDAAAAQWEAQRQPTDSPDVSGDRLFQSANTSVVPLTPAEQQALKYPSNNAYMKRISDIINGSEIESLRNPGGAVGGQTAMQLDKYRSHIQQRLSELRQVAMRVGTEQRDLMLFDYGQKFNFDRVIESVYGYPFWYLRHYGDYARQMMTDPAYLAKMFQLGLLIEKSNANKDIPVWMRQHLGMEVPDIWGIKDMFGDKAIYMPILSQIAPLQELLNGNFVNAEREKNVFGQAFNRIYGWGMGPHSLIPLIMGTINMAQGYLKNDDEAMNQGAQYFDYLGSQTRLVPAITGYMENKGYGVPGLPSGGLSVDGLAMLAGAAGFLGAPSEKSGFNFILKGLMGVGSVAQFYVTHTRTKDGLKFVGTVYDQKRVANVLVEWAQTEGKIVNGIMITPELLQDAAIVSKNPNVLGLRPEYSNAYQVWSAAVTESRARKLGPALLSYFGGPGMASRGNAEIKSEQMYRRINEIYDMADDPAVTKEMYSEAWTNLSLEFPEMPIYGIFKRFGDDAFDVYAKIALGRVGLGSDRRAVFNSVGLPYDLVSRFYEAKGIKNAFASTTEQSQFKEGIIRMNLLLKAPDMPTKLEWSAASRMYGRLMDELETQYPGTTELQDAFFSLEGESRDQFLLDHLDLKARREMEVALMLNEPEYKKVLAPYYVSIDETQNLIKLMYGQKDPQREAAYKVLLENRREWSADKEKRFMADFDLFAYDRGYNAMTKSMSDLVAALLEGVEIPLPPIMRADGMGGDYEVKMANNLAGAAAKNVERASLNNRVMSGGLGSGSGIAGGGVAGMPGGNTPRDKGSQAAMLADWEDNYSKTNVKASGYISEYRDQLSYQLLQPLLEQLGGNTRALVDAFDAPLLQGKWNYLSDSVPLDKSLVDFVQLQGAENLRGALMLNASGGWGLENQTWTKVMGTVRSMSDAEVGRLMSQYPELRDLAQVRETLKGYGAPTLNALFDTIGAHVTVGEDGSISIGVENVKKAKPAKEAGKGTKTDRYTADDVGDYVSKWAKTYFGADIEKLYDQYTMIAVVQGDRAARQFWIDHPQLAQYQEFSDQIYKRYRDAKKGQPDNKMSFMDAVAMLKMVKGATRGNSSKSNKHFGVIQAMTKLISLQSQIGGGRGGGGGYSQKPKQDAGLYANTVAVIRATNPNLANAFEELMQAAPQRRLVILQANPDLARYITKFTNQQLMDIENSFQSSFQMVTNDSRGMSTGIRVYKQRSGKTGL